MYDLHLKRETKKYPIPSGERIYSFDSDRMGRTIRGFIKVGYFNEIFIEMNMKCYMEIY